MIKNNPIQERINQLLEKWTVAIHTPEVKIVRIHGLHDEQDMVETFFKYMLAVDTDQEDFVMVLQEPFSNHEEYGKHLLEEIEEEINNWNTAKIPESIPFKTIDWKPDYTLGSGLNCTDLFVKNINNFANYLIPEKDIKVSIVIRMHYVEKDEAYVWLNSLLKLPIAPHVVFGISDTGKFPIFNKIAGHYKDEIYTIEPNLNMDEAVEQLAALGDPTAIETPYRVSMVKLMNSVKNRKAEEAQKHAKGCLKVATEGLKKDFNWLPQIVTVYTILYTDQTGYKNNEKAIYFADKAVEASLLSKEVLDPSISYRLIGQTHIGRGTLFTVQNKWEKALEDYIIASKAYDISKDYLMQCESLRLCGWASEKLALYSEATKFYIEAYLLIDKLTVETVKGSTFPYVVKNLLNNVERIPHISDEKMEEDLSPIFGEDWISVIKSYGKVPKEETNLK